MGFAGTTIPPLARNMGNILEVGCSDTITEKYAKRPLSTPNGHVLRFSRGRVDYTVHVSRTTPYTQRASCYGAVQQLKLTTLTFVFFRRQTKWIHSTLSELKNEALHHITSQDYVTHWMSVIGTVEVPTDFILLYCSIHETQGRLPS